MDCLRHGASGMIAIGTITLFTLRESILYGAFRDALLRCGFCQDGSSQLQCGFNHLGDLDHGAGRRT